MSSSTVGHILSKMQEIEEEIMSIDNREDLRSALNILDATARCIKARVKLKLFSMED